MNVGELKKYKEILYTALSRDLVEFEKYFLLVSIGILTFSITFIKDIINFENVTLLCILFISWFLFIVSSGLMMFTFLFSASSSDKLWKSVDEFIIENNKFDDAQDLTLEETVSYKTKINNVFYPSKKKLRCLRYFSTVIFIAGLICFSIFTCTNLINEKNKIKENINKYEIKLNADNFIIKADSILIHKFNDTILITK